MSKKPMKHTYPSYAGELKTDWARVDSMTDAEVLATSPPELADLPDDFWDAAVMVSPKEAISIRVDSDVLVWFRDIGPGYQTRINAVLRSYMDKMRAG